MEKKSQLIDPTEQEIILSFTNYKLLKKEEFTLKGSNIYFVKGPNEVGKTSVLNAIKAALEIKDDTKQKVTRGQSEGVNEFVFPGADGRPYRVKYEFTDASTKFVVFDPDGNKISKITEMRSIFRYNHVDATEFISWSHTAEGRRKQKELILNLLPPERYVEYMDIDNTITDIFNKRTTINKSLSVKESLLKEYKVTTDEMPLLENHEAAVKLLSAKRAEREELISKAPNIELINSNIASREQKIRVNEDEIAAIDQEIIRLQNKRKDIDSENTEVKLELAKLNETLTSVSAQATEYEKKLVAVKDKIENGEKYVQKSTEITIRHKKYTDTLTSYNELVEEEKTLTDKLNDYRKQKEEIITNSHFPVENLSFDENGYLTINGFLFDENQVCESDVILIVAQILCRLNDNPIQVIGDASLLDYDKLDRLYDIAKENGKIMFVDEIDRNLDKLVIVGYERHDTSKETSVKKTDTKPKELF